MRLIIILLLLPIMLQSQKVMDGIQFFQSNQIPDQIKSDPYKKTQRLPWIEEIEFRTETHDFLVVEQEYMLRLTPSTPGLRKVRSEILKQLQSKPEFGWLEYQCKESEKIHNEWLDLYYLQKEIDLTNELSKILDQKEVLLDRKRSSLDFNVKDLIDFRIEKTKILAKKEDLVQKMNALLTVNALSGYELDFSRFVSIEKIVLEVIKNSDHPALPDLKLNFEYELNEKEIQVENEENRQILDFVQVRFNGPNSDPLRERMSLGIGFSLPNSGNRLLKLEELKIKKNEILAEKEIEDKIRKAEVNNLQKNILFSINSYNNTRKVIQEEELYLNKILNNLSLKEGLDPEIIYDTREHMIENKLKMIDIEKDIFQLYLQYLRESGRLCVQPLSFYFKE